MGCDKRYGLREIWVTAEASPNTPGTFVDDNYLQHCTGSTFPAVYRENLENQEATGNRGQSLAFDGAQNELSWDVTVMIPASSEWDDPTGFPRSLQALFWAAGFGSDTGPTSWDPELSTGERMAIKASSACGRTIQLLGLDRDKRQLELLTGAVVSQVVFSFSRTDTCTIQFSGVAAQKYEATAPTLVAADQGQTTFSAETRTSFDMALPTSPAVLSGVSLNIMGLTATLRSITSSGITIASFPGVTITTDTPTTFELDKPSSVYTVMSPDSWSVADFSAVQSLTATMETGQSYGELTTQAQYPTEILSGQVKISASITVYITDANSGVSDYDGGYPLFIYFLPNRGGDSALKMAQAKISERPAIDLSSVDTPASGDFTLQAGENGTFSAAGLALDVLYVADVS